MKVKATSELIWNNNKLLINGLAPDWFKDCWSNESSLQDNLGRIYKHLDLKYPKFHKMDVQSKASILSIAFMNIPFENWDPYEIALIFDTASGSIVADKAFDSSRKNVPSPALFVYTLPNIFMGEIAIKHGIKGPHICMQLPSEHAHEILNERVQQMLQNKEAQAVLWGHINVTEEHIDIKIYWSIL